MTDPSVSPWPDKLGAVKDVMAVSRAFGESYVMDDTTVIPVAAVWGGGGGSRDAGSPAGPAENTRGPNSGLGFGARVRPVGVVVIKDGKVSWQPTVDVMRIVAGGQLLVLAALLMIGRRRPRATPGPSA